MTIFEWKGFVETFARIRIGASLSFFWTKEKKFVVCRAKILAS
jgi:hypothetical protein